MTSQAYCEHIVPVVYEWMQSHSDYYWKFIQDNASCHKACATIDKLRVHGIQPLEWPAFSSDLNPIEHMWKWMKDYIHLHYLYRAGIGELQQQVLEA